MASMGMREERNLNRTREKYLEYGEMLKNLAEMMRSRPPWMFMRLIDFYSSSESILSWTSVKMLSTSTPGSQKTAPSTWHRRSRRVGSETESAAPAQRTMGPWDLIHARMIMGV